MAAYCVDAEDARKEVLNRIADNVLSRMSPREALEAFRGAPCGADVTLREISVLSVVAETYPWDGQEYRASLLDSQLATSKGDTIENEADAIGSVMIPTEEVITDTIYNLGHKIWKCRFPATCHELYDAISRLGAVQHYYVREAEKTENAKLDKINREKERKQFLEWRVPGLMEESFLK